VSDIEDLFDQTEREPMPGGCEHCDAYKTVREESPGVFVLTVHHDDWCPLYRSVLS
jgi:hypothetical protein